MTITAARADARRARRELVVTWMQCIGALAAAKLLSLADPTGFLSGNLAGVAAFFFIWLPDRRLRQHGERWERYGLPWWGVADGRTWRAWGAGLGRAAAICAVLFPVFFAGFWLYSQLLVDMPDWAARLLAPYDLPPDPHLRFPARLPLLVVNQFLVVALPEEMFYRGWMQTTWAESDPSRRRRLLGATLGAGFVMTQVLFAAGHLVVFEPWRLGTFFPGLLFGWLRARTGDLTTPVAVHALSNIFIAVLEASFYGV